MTASVKLHIKTKGFPRSCLILQQHLFALCKRRSRSRSDSRLPGPAGGSKRGRSGNIRSTCRRVTPLLHLHATHLWQNETACHLLRRHLQQGLPSSSTDYLTRGETPIRVNTCPVSYSEHHLLKDICAMRSTCDHLYSTRTHRTLCFIPNIGGISPASHIPTLPEQCVQEEKRLSQNLPVSSADSLLSLKSIHPVKPGVSAGSSTTR